MRHPKVAEFFRHKATDYERWLRGMRRLQASVQVLEPDAKAVSWTAAVAMLRSDLSCGAPPSLGKAISGALKYKPERRVGREMTGCSRSRRVGFNAIANRWGHSAKQHWSGAFSELWLPSSHRMYDRLNSRLQPCMIAGARIRPALAASACSDIGNRFHPTASDRLCCPEPGDYPDALPHVAASERPLLHISLDVRVRYFGAYFVTISLFLNLTPATLNPKLGHSEASTYFVNTNLAIWWWFRGTEIRACRPVGTKRGLNSLTRTAAACRARVPGPRNKKAVEKGTAKCQRRSFVFD